jgi:hypothetical protein
VHYLHQESTTMRRKLILSVFVALAATSLPACDDGVGVGWETVVYGVQQGPAAQDGTREISGSFAIQRFQGRGPGRLHVKNPDATECFSTEYGPTPRFTEPGSASFTGPFPGGVLRLGPDPDEPTRVRGKGWRGDEPLGFSTNGFGLPPARGTLRLPAADVSVLTPEGAGPLTLSRREGLRVAWSRTDETVRVTVVVPKDERTAAAVTCFFEGNAGKVRLEPALLDRLPTITPGARLVVATHTQVGGLPGGWFMYVVAESVLVDRPLAPEIDAASPPPPDAGAGADANADADADAGADADADAGADG